MNVKRLAAIVVSSVLVALVAVAQPPSGQRDKGDHGGGGSDKGGDKAGDRREKWDRERDRFREQFEKDWEEAKAHFREHSPLRAEAFDKMSDEQKNFFKPLIIGRHRGIKWLSRDQELLNNKLRQIRIEDDIFGVKQKLAGVPAKSEEAEKLTATLRKSVESLVDARMRERALRIDRLEMLIAEERELLEEDRVKREALIDKRMQDILAAEVPVIDPPQGPPGPPSGPPGERRRPPEKRDDDNARKD
jgi:hypothetical protein